MTDGVLKRVRSLARPPGGDRRLALGDVVDAVGVQLLVADEQAVEHDQDQADEGHRGERPAPAELDGQSATQGDAEHRAERAAGQEGAGERGAAVDREDRQDDGQADAAVGGLTDPDEDPGQHQLLVVGRERRAEGGQAPDRGHQDDRLDPAPAVAEQRQGDGQHGDGQRDDADEPAELRVGQRPFQLEEGEDGGQDLPGHVVRQEQCEGEGEDDPREEPAGLLRGAWGPGRTTMSSTLLSVTSDVMTTLHCAIRCRCPVPVR